MIDKTEELDEQEDELVVPVPRIRYQPEMYYVDRKVFTGKTMPMPYVLLLYLNETELKVFTLIMDILRTTGHCEIRMQSVADILRTTRATVSEAYRKLKAMNLIKAVKIGRKNEKTINFNAIQHLHEETKDMKPGAIVALRKMMKDRNVMDMTPTTRKLWMDQFMYKDEIEEEEYN